MWNDKGIFRVLKGGDSRAQRQEVISEGRVWSRTQEPWRPEETPHTGFLSDGAAVGRGPGHSRWSLERA